MLLDNPTDEMVITFLSSERTSIGTCLRIEETVLSKLFYFQNAVFKWYKPQEAYYGNLSDSRARQDFYNDDFQWNHTISPAVYKEIRGVSYAQNRIGQWSKPQESEDLLICMTHLSPVKTMSDCLIEGIVGETEVKAVLTALLAASNTLTDNGILSSSLFKRQLISTYAGALEDLIDQLSHAFAGKDIEEYRSIINELIVYIGHHPYFVEFPQHQLQAAIDCHTDNILFFEDFSFVLIDSMFPKAAWRVLDRIHTIARLAANVAVLGNEKLRKCLYGSCHNLSKLEMEAAIVHEIRTSLMQCARRTVLGQPEIAERFREYAFSKLKQLRVME